MEPSNTCVSRPSNPLHHHSHVLQAWNGFINSFIDTVHARAPTAAPPTQPAQVCVHPPPVTKPNHTHSQSVALPSVLPAVRRLIAIGDLHGDLDKAKASFRLGGVINDKEQWVGGDTVVVQVCGMIASWLHATRLCA